ncbi:lantibiotic dehydratase [Phytohabitans sp. LJ34]|uniref:lantibiotic dehydratase n=1 Tax=Phytohabitans sp. LJ34 TaxID=3452217 RepID=UPI003F894CFE
MHAPLYRHAGGAMLRAAVLPLSQAPKRWPVLSDPGSCRLWLRKVWALPGFAEAVRYASGPFAGEVEAVLDGTVTQTRRVRRATLSGLRYLLRAVGRPTPFGMFAGVAPVEVGGEPHASWGAQHRLLVRADTLWLDAVIERLEADPAVLRDLEVVFSDLVVFRGGRIEVPRGPGRATMRNTAVVRLVREAAATPIAWQVLWAKVAEAFPGARPSTIDATLSQLVANGVLVTNLRAPMTVPDPLAYLVDAISRTTATPAGDMVGELRETRRIIHAHNATETRQDELPQLRAAVAERMRQLSSAGRTALADDLHLDCQVTTPTGLVEEMASAVTALLRLTRQPRPDPAWNDWCQRFCDRYGTGAVVPVTEAVHPDAGIGWPASYPASTLTAPDERVSRRDEQLLRLAWEAVTDGRREVVLTDELITAITAAEPVNPRWIPAHVELGARIHASSVEALRAGDYTFTVHPAQTFGTLTSRFEPTVAQAGMAAIFAATPTATAGALAAQMSFPPLFPYSENVARLPAYLPHVLPLGEHRVGGDASVIGSGDLGIVAVADGLHLVSISRRRVVEPQVFHALALEKQAPPLARLLATMGSGFLARYTEFDWGPAAARLPFLPRVRYRRAILSRATWHITAAALSQAGSWDEALAGWRQRWRCPDVVELHDDHRSLRLDLTIAAHAIVLREHLDRHGHARLTESETTDDCGWIGGHVHEIVLPFARATPPAPNPVAGPLPLVTNAAGAHLLTRSGPSWLYAKVFTHPESLDELVRVHVPRLLAMLDGDPPYWFARYRGMRETDHLRLRIRVNNANDHAAAAMAVGHWAQQLVEASAVSHLTLAPYYPEIGRYGPGPAMDAAEAVFVADSRAVAAAMRLLPLRLIHPMAVAAIGMVDIADGFHTSPDAATGWLLEHFAAESGPPVDRAIADHAAIWATRRTLPDGSDMPILVAEAWQARRAALAAYRPELPDNAFTDHVLSSLLHTHHNRARLIDRADEARCRRMARQIALTRRAHTGVSPS